MATCGEVLLLLGGVAVLIFGSWRRQQAPVIIGAIVTVISTLHLLTLFGPWLVLIPVGLILLVLGASNERRPKPRNASAAPSAACAEPLFRSRQGKGGVEGGFLLGDQGWRGSAGRR